MSQENVELLRHLFELFSEREVDVNAVLELVAPDIVWEVRSDFSDTAIYTGREGFRRLHAAFDEVVDETWYLPQGIRHQERGPRSRRAGGVGRVVVSGSAIRPGRGTRRPCRMRALHAARTP